MQPERKLKKAKIDVMRSQLPGLRLWAGLMSVGKTSLCDKTSSAYTNGRDEVYGTAFVEQLSVAELSFVCLHEAVHKGLRHLTTWRKLFEADPQLSNIACDYVVNRIIVKADPGETVCKFPRNPDGTRMGLYDERFDGMSAKQIFDILKKEQEQEPDGQGEGKPGEQGANQKQGSGAGQGFDEHGWDDAKEMDKADRDALDKEIDHALRRGEAEAKRCGAGKGDMPAEVGELLRPAVDWRAALREFFSSHCAAKDEATWRRLNRRFVGMDVYLPTMHGESLGHAVVGADLSGSMWSGNPSPISRIFTEVVEIANTTKPDKLDVLYWDTEVAGHDSFTQGDYDGLLAKVRPKGGGGTSAACVPIYMAEHKIKPDCIIMVTDGHVFGSWGSNYSAPVLWVIIDNPSVEAPSGKTLHVSL
jgi:predicted metal-dependent peptidase